MLSLVFQAKFSEAIKLNTSLKSLSLCKTQITITQSANCAAQHFIPHVRFPWIHHQLDTTKNAPGVSLPKRQLALPFTYIYIYNTK